MQDRSRGPRISPGRTDPVMEEKVEAARQIDPELFDPWCPHGVCPRSACGAGVQFRSCNDDDLAHHRDFSVTPATIYFWPDRRWIERVAT